MGKKKHSDATWAINTTSHVQVLGLGTDIGDVAPSVLLFFDKQRYLFNAGEGFQRYATQHQIKLNRMTDVLLTRSSSGATGGLPGMSLTLSDSFGEQLPAKVPFRLNIYGPLGVSTLVRAVQTFIDRRGVSVHAHEFGKAKLINARPDQDAQAAGTPSDGGLPPVVESPAVVITPVQLMPEMNARHANGSTTTQANELDGTEDGPATKRARTDAGSSEDGGNAEAGAQGAQRNSHGHWSTTTIAAASQRPSQMQSIWLHDGDAPPLAEEGPAACYICQLAAMPGRFLPEKAAALGVPKGPLFGRLKAGNAVDLPGGQTVQPNEVMEEGVPGARVVIADCPSEHYLPALLGSTAFEPVEESSAAAGLLAIVHLTPAEVVRLPQYVEWMTSFGPSAQHIVVAAAPIAGTVAVLESSAILQARLNALVPHIFPLPPYDTPQPPLSLDVAKSTPGTNLLKFHLRPRRAEPLDSGDVPPPFSAAAVQADFRQQNSAVFEVLQRSMDVASTSGDAVPDCIRRAGRESLELLFLGTGAAMPSKYRNVTATYLHMFAHGGMLLDCGEGTYGQLRRRYGAAADGIVAGLKCVWISHIHADHHAGLARILAVRTALLGPGAAPLPVIGPRPLRRVLAAVAQLEPMGFRYIDTSNTLPLPPDHGSQQVAQEGGLREAVEQVKDALNLARLESFPVVHCAHAFGLALASRDGWSLALSGDTRPCDAVVQAATGATILIHEATFGSERTEDGEGYEYEQEAVAKRHSMTHEAVAAGRAAGAYRTILTHFSQRYPKIPVIDASFAASTCIAFDLMSVNLQDLPSLPAVVPALQLLFQDSNEEEVADAARLAMDEGADLAAGEF